VRDETGLLLVGAGHAHLHVVAHAAELRAAGYRVRLLAPRWFDYSGVASATATGALPADAGRIDVRALAAGHGVELVEDTLVGIDTVARVATTADGAALAYDLVSLNVGSVAATHDIEVDDEVVRVKPLAGLGALATRLAAHPGATVTVVGGGSSGLELAAHLAVTRGVTRVRLVEAGPVLGPDLPGGARRSVTRLLARRGVEVHLGTPVRRLAGDHLLLGDGRRLDHDLAVLATGLVASPLLARLGLGDADGVPVTATLQHPDHPEMLAAGDCAHFLPQPLARIGVHGVRQGPVLLAGLLARAHGEPAPSYTPQRRALAVLDLGAGIGLAVRGRWWWRGRTAFLLKRRIDRRWLRRYRSPTPSGAA
jgi:NADH dehydrogenase FAD-containing subunit